jgi:hypothetical protein
MIPIRVFIGISLITGAVFHYLTSSNVFLYYAIVSFSAAITANILSQITVYMTEGYLDKFLLIAS